jgi:23S rRNA pseudouridine1911/1915/1917 synthase
MADEDSTLLYVVPKSHAGLRVDVFLKSRLKKISRTRVRQIIESGHCTFRSRRPMTPSSRVEGGDVICIRREPQDEVEVPLTYGVIHEDSRILVVDKPAGLPVHPTSRYMKGNLLTLIRKDFGSGHLNLCHRIDRETSGIVLLSRDLDGERFIKRQFSSRKVHKSYLALVKGHPSPAEGLVDAPLRRNPYSRVHTKMEVAVGPRILSPGKPARTRYRTVDRSQRFALVECFPETGRQHQIRIHMAHLGHPIVGDKIYSVGERVFLEFIKSGFTEAVAPELLMPRQALHAHRLSFLHPDGSREVSFLSKLADDIRSVFEADL